MADFAGNPAAVAWQRALAGQLPGSVPEGQMFPADPNKGGVENFIRALASSTLNMPQTAVAGYKNTFGLPFGLGTSTPAPVAAAPTLPEVPAPLAPGLTVPGTPLKTQVGGGERSFTFPAGPETPAPPTLPAPPQMKATGGGNYSGVKALADKAKPGPVDQANLDKAHWGDVLGGLAGGAGSVDATDAGSFAKALAMAGAGGSKGSKDSAVRGFEANSSKDKENQQFYTNRANLEKGIVSAQATAQQHAAQVAFQNAKLVWDTNIHNQNAQYEYNAKKLQLEQPQIKQDANGVSITQMDPQTRQWNMRYVPTKPVFDSLEKMKPVFEGLGVGNEAAKAANIEFIGKQYANDTLGGREVMKRLAVQDLVGTGAGSAVFGQAFQKAATAAKTELDAQLPGLMAKPAEYISELNSRISAKILSMPEVGTNLGWAIKGVAHSPYARVLAGSK